MPRPLATLLLAAAAAAGAQPNPVPLSPDALFAMRTIMFGSRIAVSTNGRYVAYVALDPRATTPDSDQVTLADGWRMRRTGAPAGVGQVWVIDLVTHREAPITTTGHNWTPVWSPTATELAFLSDHDGRAGLWIWRPQGYQPALQRVSAAPVSCAYYGAIRWTSDGRQVLVASPPVADLARSGHVSSATRRVAADSPRVEVRTAGLSVVSAAPAAGNVGIPTVPSEIVRIDVRTGTQRVIARDADIDWIAPSPDGLSVAYAALRAYSLPEGRQYQAYYSLLVAPMDGGSPREVVRRAPISFYGRDVISWTPDSKSLVYSTTGLHAQQGFYRVSVGDTTAGIVTLTPFSGLPDSMRTSGQGVAIDSSGTTIVGWSGSTIWRYDAATGQGREVARLDGRNILGLVRRAGSGSLYEPPSSPRAVVAIASDNSGTTAGFYRVDLATGATTSLYEVPKSIGGESGVMASNTTIVTRRGDDVIFLAESASEPPELWWADAGFTHAERLSHMSGAVLDGPLGERRIVHWMTASGERRQGILLLPSNYHTGERYPLIVWMYEQSIPYYVNTFGLAGQAFFNLQLFATRGYACFYPDLRWTKDSVLPSLGEQVHDGVRELASLGIADSTRVGIVGQSSGGYDILAVATAYPGVRAGVAVSGIADMVMEFGSTMDDPVGFDWAERQMGLGAPPWEHPERYVLNSPSYHFDRVQASLLLLEGTADDFTRAHMDLAFAELKRLGKRVEYRRYPGDGHVPDEWVPANRRDAERRMLEWFDSYVMKSQSH